MKSRREFEVEKSRHFCLNQAKVWRQEGDVNNISISNEWYEKAEGTDDQLFEEAEIFLAGTHYDSSFSSFNGRNQALGPYSNAEYPFDDIDDVNEGDIICIEYLWTPIDEDDEDQKGVFVCRAWNSEKKKEISGTRFHHDELDNAVAATLIELKNKEIL